MVTIGIKYCGGCNPRIDRGELVRRLERLLPPGCLLVTGNSSEGQKIGVLVCGCPVACAARKSTGDIAARWLRVAGETLDLKHVPECSLAEAVAEKIRGLI